MACLATLSLSLASQTVRSQGRAGIQVPPTSYSGKVLDGGKPVAGAKVIATYRRFDFLEGESSLVGEVTERSAITGDDGSYRLVVAPWRRASLYAIKDGRCSTVRDYISPIDPLDYKKFRVLELGSTWSVSGQLRYRRRAVKEKIPFELRRLSAQEGAARLAFRGVTDEQGRIQMQGLPPGPYQLFTASTKWRLRRPTTLGNASAEGAKPAKISVIKAVSLTGRLTTSGSMGKPIVGADIELVDGQQIYRTKSDLEGLFTLRGLEEGPGATILIQPGPQSGVFARCIRSLEPGLSSKQEAPQFEIKVENGKIASGRILNAFGRPVPKIPVLFRCFFHPLGVTYSDLSVRTVTNGDGRYESKNLSLEAGYDVFAILPTGEHQRIGRMSPMREKKLTEKIDDFTLNQNRAIAELQVPKGFDTSDVEMRIYGPKEQGGEIRFDLMIPIGQGRFVTPSLRSGEYVVFAVKPGVGIARGLLPLLRQSPGQLTPQVRLTLGAARKVRGSVLNPAGNGVSGAQIHLVPAGGKADGSFRNWHDFIANTIFDGSFKGESYIGSTKTDANGNFELLCREASGKYDLLVTPAGANPGQPAGPDKQPVRVPDVLGEPSPVKIRIR